MLKYAFGLIVSYVLAAPLTARISLNLAETDWLHIMTYVWWFGAMFVWVFIVIFAVLLILALKS